jgi:hypothetical protein
MKLSGIARIAVGTLHPLIGEDSTWGRRGVPMQRLCASLPSMAPKRRAQDPSSMPLSECEALTDWL